MEINKFFVESCDKVIAELSMQDMLAHRAKLSKAKQRNYKGGYSLSVNTLYLLETKKAYQAGEITEEEAKAIFLKQKLLGNAI